MEEQGEIIFKMQQGKFLSQTNLAKISLYPTNLAKIPFNLLQKQDQSITQSKRRHSITRCTNRTPSALLLKNGNETKEQHEK